MDPYEALANAIVIQAADDYRAAARQWYRADKKIKKARSREERNEAVVEKRQATLMMKEVTAFFMGKWCAELTKADGEYIITRLKKEMRL